MTRRNIGLGEPATFVSYKAVLLWLLQVEVAVYEGTLYIATPKGATVQYRCRALSVPS